MATVLEKRETIDKLIIELGRNMLLADEISKAFYEIRRRVIFDVGDQYRNNGEAFVNLVIKFILKKVSSDWKSKLRKEREFWTSEFAQCKETKDIDGIIKLIKKKNKLFKKATKTKVNKSLKQITDADFLIELSRESREMHMVIMDYLHAAEELAKTSAFQDAKVAKLLDEIDNELMGSEKNE